MKVWKELIRNAILGTSKQRFSENTLGDLQEKGLDINLPPEELLLQGAVLYRNVQRAQYPLRLEKLPTDEVKLLSEEQAYCSPSTARRLDEILYGNRSLALKEFIFYLRKGNQILRPEALPALFDYCLRRKEQWEQIYPVIGKRGQWLLEQRKSWQPLQQKKDTQHWLLSVKEDRVAMLKYWRLRNPDHVLELLESTWEQDSLSMQKEALQILKGTFSPTAIPFLEKGLVHKRKEIRELSRQSLSFIEHSSFRKRMEQRASLWLSLENDAILVRLPKEHTDTEKRDGFLQDSTVLLTLKGQESCLAHLLENIPPSFWETHFSHSPSILIPLFNDASLSLNAPLYSAALKYDDKRWLEAIVEYWLMNWRTTSWDTRVGKQLLKALTNDSFNRLLVRRLSNYPALIIKEDLVLYLLKMGEHYWSEELSILVIKRFQDWLNTTREMDWSGQSYRSLLEVAAYRANLRQYENLVSGWNYRSSLWPYWADRVDQFIKILTFRRDMAREFLN